MLRFPDGMRDKIRRLADQNKRSMNAEIIARLESAIESADVMEQYEAHKKTKAYEQEIAQITEVVKRVLEQSTSDGSRFKIPDASPDEDLQDPLDRFIADSGDAPSRSEAIRRALRDYLREKGYLSTVTQGQPK